MSNLVTFPVEQRPFTEAEIDKLHAEAFRDLESRISDCVLMSTIALEMAERAIEGREEKHEKAMFIVFELVRMLKRLKAGYHASWHGESGTPSCD